MADSKISALTSATTPLAGTEVLPIVQSSTTVKVTVDNLTTGRSVSAASLSLTTTPLAVGSGGTGLTNLGSGYIPYGNATSAFSSSSGFTYSGNLLTATTTTSGNSNVLSLINTNGPGGGQGVAIIGYSASGTNNLGKIAFGGAGALGGLLDIDLANSSGVNAHVMRISSSSGVGINTTSDPGAGNLELGTGNVTISTSGKGITTTSSIPLGFGTNTGTSTMTLNTSGSLSIYQATTAAAPAYVKGAMYFDTTLNKFRIGGATTWETVTSV